MRVLVLGATGMLGHRLVTECRDRFDTWATVRGDPAALVRCGLLSEDRVLGGIDAGTFDAVDRVFADVRPAAVVNCIGIVKQVDEARDPIRSIRINALFPHQLARLACAAGARLVHLSTDCVFSGRDGGYDEEDIPDPIDLYGRSKLLGEVHEGGALTLRTSMIGRELVTSNGLVEWFLSNRGGTVPGYAEAVFSGLPTPELARLIATILADHLELEGLYHVAATPISKLDLLNRLAESYGVEIAVRPDSAVRVDRSLDGSRFASATGWHAPPWPEMLSELARDRELYDDWRQHAFRG